MKPFEVEQKFLVDDLDAVQQRLGDLGAQFAADVLQIDRYYAHPARDFARSDEALRLRQVGPRNLLTYKGPKLDSTTKTRREIELSLGDGEAEAQRMDSLLQALGFAPVATVRKRRRGASLVWQDATVLIALDDVDRVGRFVELELNADQDELDVARAIIQSLARQLGLSRSERRSYLELLLAPKADGFYVPS